MRHCGTAELHTPRLHLRRFTVDDTLPMFRNWASDPAVTRYLTWAPHRDPAQTEQLLRFWCGEYRREDFYQWAIVCRQTGQLMGSISVVACDTAVGKAQLGYCIGRAFWGRGYTTEAMRAVIAYLFDTVGAQRVEARHDVQNPASGAVMRKCGMEFEGVQRRSDRNNTGICDTAWYAILKE